MRTPRALADLPVTLVSAYGRGETIAQPLEASAADYFVKPFPPAELVARIGVALNLHIALGPFVLGDLVVNHTTRRVAEPGQRSVACQGAHHPVARHQESFPAIARRAKKLDTRPQAMHARLDRFNPTKHHHGG